MEQVVYVLRSLVKNYFAHNVGKNRAALAYYLLFAIFPLLIFISNLLGLLQLDVYTVTQYLARLLPQDVTRLLAAYLQHINEVYSPVMLWFSMVFSVWFPYRAVKGLVKDVRTAYGLPQLQGQPLFFIKQLAYTFLLLLTLAVSLTVSVLGQRLLLQLFSLLPADMGLLPGVLLPVWKYFRFIPAGIAMYAAIVALYGLSLEKMPSPAGVLPGLAASVVAWLAVSGVFSFYVENFAGYSVIYGALGAVMALLIWLQLSAVILIMGAELNAVLAQTK